MSRPSDLPPAGRYRHGARARYVAGCRCDPCRASNTAYYHQRQARAKALAAELPPIPAWVGEEPAPQVWTAPDGSKRVRVYARACPGVNGEACSLRAHLRKDSKGGCCRSCREKLVWNGLVDAGPARAHLRALSRRGVGRRAVAAACDVSPTILEEVKLERKQLIRKRTAERILAVDVRAVADHGLVSARPTWALLERLRREGYTAAQLCRLLGFRSGGLQFRRGKVLARTALRVEKLYRELNAEAQE